MNLLQILDQKRKYYKDYYSNVKFLRSVKYKEYVSTVLTLNFLVDCVSALDLRKYTLKYWE